MAVDGQGAVWPALARLQLGTVAGDAAMRDMICSRTLLSFGRLLTSRSIVLSALGCFGMLDRRASLVHEL